MRKTVVRNLIINLSATIIFLLIEISSVQAQSPRPNFLIILADDMVYHSLSINTNDTLIQTPNIDRIGHEGADIKYYCTNSLCMPGRASLLSGKYGHTTGAVNNSTYIPNSSFTLPKILHDNGYFTAMIGKWMISSQYPKPEFDYWLWSPNSSTYYNDTCMYFTIKVPVVGHMTDFQTDSVLALISRIDTPFFILLNYNAPHYPFTPQTQFNGIYNSANFNLPGNFEKYDVNFPSFLYSYGSSVSSETSYQNSKRNYFPLFMGIEEATGKIYNALHTNGLLDNTMLIFTADNSNLIGEHGLSSKLHPYEEGMRLPLLIRYPQWFAPTTILNSDFALNIDMAPTLLDAAGIQDTTGMEGISLHNLATGTANRNCFLYEQVFDSNQSPFTVKTFRDNYFQYNCYYCSDTTEELFDMNNDPMQKINLVHHEVYHDTLALYRIKLDSLRIAMNDTASLISGNCFLMNSVYTPVNSASKVGVTKSDFFLSPNPANNWLNIFCKTSNSYFTLSDILGRELFTVSMNDSDSEKKTVDITNLKMGIISLPEYLQILLK